MPSHHVGEFALQLVTAFQTWQSPQTMEAALDYFAGDRRRHGGDELPLRTSLVKDHILQ